MPTCRLYPAPPVRDAETVARMRRFPTSVLSDQMERFGATRGLRPVLERPTRSPLAGPALTVLTRPGDNLALYQAVESASPGDVLVVDAGGATDRAVMGEISYRYAAAKGIAGMVIDGAVRDSAEIANGPVPVYVRGVTHLGPSRHGPGEIYGPIAVGGVVVCAGDLVVGDADGLVVVPWVRAREVITGAERQMEAESSRLTRAERGEADISWLASVDLVRADPR